MNRSRGSDDEIRIPPTIDMKSLSKLALIGAIAIVPVSCDDAKEAASDAAEATKEAASNAADATKEAASDAAEATEEAAGNATDAAREFVSGAQASVEEALSDDPVEAIAEKVGIVLTEIPDALLSIKDEESLTAAEGKLDGLVTRLEASAKALEALPKPDAATRAAISDKMENSYQAEFEEGMQKATEHIGSLPAELQPRVQGLMMGFFGKLQGVGSTFEAYFDEEEVEEEIEEAAEAAE